MYTYVVSCLIDHKRTEITVKASDRFAAQKLVKAQYPNSTVTITTVRQTD